MTILSQIANELKTQMENSPHFPFSDRKNYPLSKRFRPHMKDVALRDNPIIMLSPEVEYFEIGNDYAEVNAPQYHILEDAKIIKNPNMGTKQSLGSQRRKKIENRDYGRNIYLSKEDVGKEFGQEYRQSFRSRTNIWKANIRIDQLKYKHGNKKTYRYNTHWAYIERILEQITPMIADSVNAKLVVGMGYTPDVEVIEPMFLNDEFFEQELPNTFIGEGEE